MAVAASRYVGFTQRLQRNKAFVAAYRAARRDWLAGLAVVFPAGTYWLRRFAGVPVAAA